MADSWRWMSWNQNRLLLILRFPSNKKHTWWWVIPFFDKYVLHYVIVIFQNYGRHIDKHTPFIVVGNKISYHIPYHHTINFFTNQLTQLSLLLVSVWIIQLSNTPKSFFGSQVYVDATVIQAKLWCRIFYIFFSHNYGVSTGQPSYINVEIRHG